jgi:hypothetical protein
MSDSDYVMGADNNYETTDTAAGMMYRCAMAHRGQWPGGNGEEIGCAFWDRWPLKNSETTRNQGIADFTEAMQPLVDAGRITDVTVTYSAHSNISRGSFLIKAYDVSQRDNVTVSITAPWGP